MSELGDLIDYISKTLVDAPDQVQVNEVRRGANHRGRASEWIRDDLGKVIGKQGPYRPGHAGDSQCGLHQATKSARCWKLSSNCK